MIIGLNTEELQAYMDITNAGVDPIAALVHLTAAVGFDIVDLDEPEMQDEPEEPVNEVK